MTAIDLPTLKNWCQRRRYALGDHGLPAFRDTEDCETFTIPSDAGQRVALVRNHLGWFAEEDETCLWLADWSVWPSGQWRHTFDRLRLSYGISEPLVSRPGHLVVKGDFEAAISVAVYSVLMLWDCYVLGSSGMPFLFYSHDEYGKRGEQDGAANGSQPIRSDTNRRSSAAGPRRWPSR
jgi:hypothetical protein